MHLQNTLSTSQELLHDINGIEFAEGPERLIDAEDYLYPNVVHDVEPDYAVITENNEGQLVSVREPGNLYGSSDVSDLCTVSLST